MNAVVGAPSRVEASRSGWYVVRVVVLYTAGFFGLLPVVLWNIGAAFDRGFALPPLSPAARPAGAVLLAAGALALLGSMRALVVRGRGLPISHLPPSLLVARGIYARLRHPIYVAYAITLLGAGLSARSFGRSLLAPLLLWTGSVIYALGFEEPRLLARFGPCYAEYARGTPLLPVPFAAELAALAQRGWLAVRPVAEQLANRTVLFRIGGSVWVTYGALVALGGVAGAVTAAPLLAGLGLSSALIAFYELGLALSMLAGGRLVWLAYEWRRVWREPSIVVRRVGFVSFGGYAGFLLFTPLFAWLEHLPALALLDRTLPPAFLISACGRLGCLSYGCCYGRPCRHGLRWSDPQSKVNREHGALGRVPRVPTPLLASGLAASLSALGFTLLAHAALPGAVSASVLLAYATLRFGIEHFRDEPRLWRPAFTRGQLLSLPIAVLALLLLVSLPPGAVTPVAADFSVLPALGPVFAAVGAFAFVVCGFHRREVGRW